MNSCRMKKVDIEVEAPAKDINTIDFEDTREESKKDEEDQKEPIKMT